MVPVVGSPGGLGRIDGGGRWFWPGSVHQFLRAERDAQVDVKTDGARGDWSKATDGLNELSKDMSGLADASHGTIIDGVHEGNHRR
jgi:hypothetical protein